MSPVDIGATVDVIDEAVPAASQTATDTMFLIHPAPGVGSAVGLTDLGSLDEARTAYPAEVSLLPRLETFFEEGGARAIVSPLAATPDIPTALARFRPEHGPGQLVAPTLVASADCAALAEWGWGANRVYIANGAAAAADAALNTLSDGIALASGGASRFAALEGDEVLVEGTAPGTTRTVPGSVVAAALIARSDIATGNPNLAAAGVNGVVRTGVGIVASRTRDNRNALADNQINTYAIVKNQVRHYGFRTLANLATYPDWWDLSGARTVMAVRAMEADIAEDMTFGQVDATGSFLDKYEGALRGVLAALQRLGAIFGTAEDPGYSVDVGRSVNPLSQLKTGVVKAQIIIRTSPFAESLQITLVRRAIDRAV